MSVDMNEVDTVRWTPPASQRPASAEGLSQAILEGLTVCQATQKGAPAELSAGLVQIWERILSGEATAAQVERAFTVWLKSEPFFPTPADILEIAQAAKQVPFVPAVDDTQPLPERTPTDEQRANAKRIRDMEADIAAKMGVDR